MARAFGSYPECHWFKSSCRYQHLRCGSFANFTASLFGKRHAISFSSAIARYFPASHAFHGPLVKRLRLRPFTAATRVRVPYGSPSAESALTNRALTCWVRVFCSREPIKNTPVEMIDFQQGSLFIFAASHTFSLALEIPPTHVSAAHN